LSVRNYQKSTRADTAYGVMPARTSDSFILDALPCDERAEKTVLGILLVFPERFAAVRHILSSEEFREGPRRSVYTAMQSRGSANPTDVIDALEAAKLDEPENISLLINSLGDQAGSGNLRDLLHYARKLKADGARRRRIELSETLRAAAQRGDLNTQLAAVEQLSQVREYCPPEEETKIVCAKNLLAKTIQPREYLLDPVLTTSALAEIFSWRGIGKTWFGLSLCGAVSSGGSFLSWKAPKARKTLYIDGELDEFSLQQRIRLLGIDNENFLVLCTDAQDIPFPHLATAEAQQKIEANLDGVELLVIDNLSALAPASNEEEGEQWIRIQTWFRELKRKHGTSIVFLHHAGHSGTSRGTTRREDLCDLVIELRRPKDYKASEGLRMELVFGKTRGKLSRYAESLECSLAEFNGQLLWAHKELEDVRASEVADMRANGMSEREIAKETNIPRSTVQRLLQKAQARK
jgi:hypothetical protein